MALVLVDGEEGESSPTGRSLVFFRVERADFVQSKGFFDPAGFSLPEKRPRVERRSWFPGFRGEGAA